MTQTVHILCFDSFCQTSLHKIWIIFKCSHQIESVYLHHCQHFLLWILLVFLNFCIFVPSWGTLDPFRKPGTTLGISKRGVFTQGIDLTCVGNLKNTKMKCRSHPEVVTAKISRAGVEWCERRKSGEGPERDGLGLSWGATWLVRLYSSWHFDDQAGGAQLKAHPRRCGVAGVGGVQGSWGLKPALSCRWCDADRNWKPEVPSVSSQFPVFLWCLVLAEPDRNPAERGVSGISFTVPALASQSRKEKLGLEAIGW